MTDVPTEKRSALRYSLVLAVELIELPRGAKLSGRTSDIGRSGCYIDTLNPLPKGSQVRLRMPHHGETFEGIGRVVYTSPALGMGLVFETVTAEEQAKLERWLNSPDEEF